MFRCLPLLVLGACAATPPGPPPNLDALAQRFVIDRIALPATANEARSAADDLDGDGTVDNQFGSVTSLLAGQADVNTHGADMIQAGAIAWTVYVRQAGSQGEVWVVGGPDVDTVPVIGTFDRGSFTSDRVRDGATTGVASVALPVFADSDPTTIDLQDLEVELVADGNGGFDATIHGTIPDALALAGDGLLAMVEANPRAHTELIAVLDRNRDGTLTPDEVAAGSFVASLLAPDLEFDGRRVLSAGLSAHLTPCPTGSCTTGAATCFDRVRDGDEVGVDCGGSCGVACLPGDTCTTGTDCVSGACDGGHCAAATCTDGHADGLESDVDCGGGCDTRCAEGKTCFVNEDCAHGGCSTCTTSNAGGEACSGPGTCN